MRVLYDHQIFNQGAGGASRYYSEVINDLAINGDVEPELSLKYSSNIYLNESRFGDGKYLPPNNSGNISQFLPGINFRGKGRVFNTYSKIKKQINISGENLTNSISLLQKQDFDIFHPTYYDPYFLKYLGDKPFVLTILDMNHELYPEYFQGEDMLAIARNKQLLAEKATRIIAISEQTKQDVVEILGIKPGRIDVVYLANSLDPQLGKESKFDLPKKFILYVGHRWIYKNFFLFARAVSRVMEEDKDIHLVCIGGGAFSTVEKGYFDLLGIGNRIVQISADEPTLAKAYDNAQLFAYPSLYEGFGIPLLEAFACECPVVCSNVSCFPEIAADAALYFEPKSLDSITNSLVRVLEDQDLQAELRKRGTERLKSFSWGQTARQTREVYHSII